MSISFHPAARAEFDEATAFYEAATPGLGVTFVGAIGAALVRLEDRPHVAPRLPRRPHVRRAVVQAFPYAIVYTISGDELRVLAIAHQHRKPRYWANRLSS